MPEYNLKDKVVLITGASAGIGAGIAEAFAGEGAKIAITGRNEASLKQVASKCQALGLPAASILTIIVDHGKEADNDKTITQTIDNFGQLDVLINNAGTLIMGSTEGCSKNDYNTLHSVNMRAPFRLAQLAIPHLRKTKGNIINISSLGSLAGTEQVTPYCMTKAALDNMTRSCCLEVARDGIRINSINPGYIRSKIITRTGMNDAMLSAFEEERLSKVPIGRHGEPRDIARVALYLASDRASFITGVILPVDGGWIAACP